MASFKDGKGREWQIKLSLPVLIEVCTRLKLRLADLTELNFPLAEVLSAIPLVCHDEMKEKGISPKEFDNPDVMGPAQIGGALRAMQDAVMQAFGGNEDIEDTEASPAEGSKPSGPTDPGPSET